MSIIYLLVILGAITIIPAAYATDDVSYDDKVEFEFKMQQIYSHVISALGNIHDGDYSLAKMHFIHPMAEHYNITDYFTHETYTNCTTHLKLALNILQYTDPHYPYQNIHDRIKYVFELLNKCDSIMINKTLNNDLSFKQDVIDKMLEKSISEYDLSLKLHDMGKKMEYQDALGLVIRSHMLSKNLFNEDLVKSFETLFIAYPKELSLTQITILTNELRNDILSVEIDR